tara:strand:+ start:204 stop:482 length:279 start_codon:yes stop_codon:yes gene_type:complete
MGLCDEFRHTPGPWGNTVYADGYRSIFLDAAKSGYGDEPATDADRKLMAAAPEMLELICDWYDFTNQGYQTAAETEFIERAEGVVGKAKDWD